MSVAVLEVRYWNKPSDRSSTIVTVGVLEQDWELIKKVGCPGAGPHMNKRTWHWCNPLDNHLEYVVYELWASDNVILFDSVSVGRAQHQASVSFKDGRRAVLEESEEFPKTAECILYDKEGNKIGRRATSNNMLGWWRFYDSNLALGYSDGTSYAIRVYEEPELSINTDFEYHANTMIELLKAYNN